MDNCGMSPFSYMFMRNEVGGIIMPVIVGRCRTSKLLVAHVVQTKGDGYEWVAAQLVKDVKKMGHYGPLIVKSDGEPALLSVVERTAQLRDAEEREEAAIACVRKNISVVTPRPRNTSCNG